jgi:hypothetical protein
VHGVVGPGSDVYGLHSPQPSILMLEGDHPVSLIGSGPICWQDKETVPQGFPFNILKIGSFIIIIYSIK